MSTKTMRLIRGIDSGITSKDSTTELIDLARFNKVLLGFLRRIGYEGHLRVREEDRYREYMSRVVEVSKALNDLDYALFKFRRPIEHVSVDVDVLLRSEHLSKALRKMCEMGFRVEVLEPYTVTVVKDWAIVDLYTHPSLAWIVYLDGERLLEETDVIELDGVEARVLTREAEVVVAAAHAIYKEHIYLLTDYYVTKRWLNSRVMRLAEELRSEEAVQISLELNRRIEQALIETPIKLNGARVIGVLTRKFIGDSNFRATSINLLKVAARKRTAHLLIQRMRRRAY